MYKLIHKKKCCAVNYIILNLFFLSLINCKIYEKCELAQELRYGHNLPIEDVEKWVCIAQHQSGFNSSAVAYQSDGSGYHGMFQISDTYWCSPPGEGLVCGLSCSKLRDDNLYDDFECMNKIYQEHQGISGDGYNAWPSYQNNCSDGKSEGYVKWCFSENFNQKNFNKKNKVVSKKQTGKVYKRCELAKELRYKHELPLEQIATWVCIAKHESSFNTSAVGRLNADGSGDHGLFQISDIYWCSPPGKGWVCGLSCSQLEDDDISDDVECMKKIYAEHQGLSGDGFNAWTVYKPHCRGKSEKYINGCFDANDDIITNNLISIQPGIQAPKTTTKPTSKKNNKHNKNKEIGKVYERCELARELYYKHNLAMEQIANWVCIAKHESSFNTSAIGRLNADGSGDHGLFQISDIYWCSPPGKGWVCGLSCSKLEDSDISDDVQCMKKIYEEHEGLSGDGFNAWTVYKPHCRGKSDNYISGCFSDDSDNLISKHSTVKPVKKTKIVTKGKIYERCELAKELRNTHNIPFDQIGNYVCIAQHSSSFNTSAISEQGSDGTAYHGMYQLSDQYWCSPPGKGTVCGLSCADLRDSDISDDLDCIKKIYEEHQRLSGDGFNAWAVYQPHCRGKTETYISDCFDMSSIPKPVDTKVGKGKIYEKCELADELLKKHKLPREQIATWVCIAYHESRFDTSVVGRLNADGSGDHGLFQISDIYWCSPPGKGWGCGLSCSKLEDNDITDDVQCMKKIYAEHQRLSGDGFNAWAVYQPYCRGRSDSFIKGCRGLDNENAISSEFQTEIQVHKSSKKSPKGKIYERCELAKELRDTHNIPFDQIGNYVCIAQHSSSFNTSAISEQGSDGTAYHGMYQLSDQYWCSPPGKGTVCGLSCADLRDSDISDDLGCLQKIYEEHQRLSGDGFNAWAVYQPHCRGKTETYISDCFDMSSIPKPVDTKVGKGKIYEKCELAEELLNKHKLPREQIATWVCIAYHESRFDTSIVGRLNADGSGDHGLFQISDIYWCSPPGKGWGCGLSCSKLEDNDITDDVQCMKKIYAEHQRLSGDGFNAWAVYQPYCRGRSESYTKDCSLSSSDNKIKMEHISNTVIVSEKQKPIGKIYKRCELAKELKSKHNIPYNQIGNYVCIAQHSSNFNTSAISAPSSDGTAYHGMYQLSDQYWCSPPGKGTVCGLTCSQLRDNDISDDLECIKKIYEEHQRLSGDGFNAWSSYKTHCLGKSDGYISDCFENDNRVSTDLTKKPNKFKHRPKIYDRCELAQELHYKHNLPIDQVPTWVCIAYHESHYNTSAVGRLNADESEDHGLFQISDMYWCSPPGKGRSCALSCAQLKDDDITDDVECIKTIYAEHQKLSGNGFNAWSVYKPYCQEKSQTYTIGCFDIDNEDAVSNQLNVYQLASRNDILSNTKPVGKIYHRCELAQELLHHHNIPFDQLRTWVCIAQYTSGFNTSALTDLTTDGSTYHGIYQLSDEFWCSTPGKGLACGLTCSQLRDSNLSDDIECIKKVYDEHQRISGDGFNAWAVYPKHCRDQSESFIADCFEVSTIMNYQYSYQSSIQTVTSNTIFKTANIDKGTGKIYERCELAQELRYKYEMPIAQLATWVCIANYESNYNTAAVGRLNSDGSGDHGIFQISDLYWCSPSGTRWGCRVSCSELEDSDITDDVQCVKKILAEHLLMTGDGFNAWSVYIPYCRHQSERFLTGCFDTETENVINAKTNTANKIITPPKIYEACELARELRYKHKMEKEEIAVWVCIAKYESNFNTSAVGYMNFDGSTDHGIFQISDIYWCSPPGKGYACGLTCAQLEDNDITDDVQCIRKIYNEHKKLSGDGYNAWTVYSLFCRGQADKYIDGCFDDDKIILDNFVTQGPRPAITQPPPSFLSQQYHPTTKSPDQIYQSKLAYNPFFSFMTQQPSISTSKPNYFFSQFQSTEKFSSTQAPFQFEIYDSIINSQSTTLQNSAFSSNEVTSTRPFNIFLNKHFNQVAETTTVAPINLPESILKPVKSNFDIFNFYLHPTTLTTPNYSFFNNNFFLNRQKSVKPFIYDYNNKITTQKPSFISEDVNDASTAYEVTVQPTLPRTTVLTVQSTTISTTSEPPKPTVTPSTTTVKTTTLLTTEKSTTNKLTTTTSQKTTTDTTKNPSTTKFTFKPFSFLSRFTTSPADQKLSQPTTTDPSSTTKFAFNPFSFFNTTKSPTKSTMTDQTTIESTTPTTTSTKSSSSTVTTKFTFKPFSSIGFTNSRFELPLTEKSTTTTPKTTITLPSSTTTKSTFKPYEKIPTSSSTTTTTLKPASLSTTTKFTFKPFSFFGFTTNSTKLPAMVNSTITHTTTTIKPSILKYSFRPYTWFGSTTTPSISTPTTSTTTAKPITMHFTFKPFSFQTIPSTSKKREADQSTKAYVTTTEKITIPTISISSSSSSISSSTSSPASTAPTKPKSKFDLWFDQLKHTK